MLDDFVPAPGCGKFTTGRTTTHIYSPKSPPNIEGRQAFCSEISHVLSPPHRVIQETNYRQTKPINQPPTRNPNQSQTPNTQNPQTSVNSCRSQPKERKLCRFWPRAPNVRRRRKKEATWGGLGSGRRKERCFLEVLKKWICLDFLKAFLKGMFWGNIDEYIIDYFCLAFLNPREERERKRIRKGGLCSWIWDV